MRRWKSLLLVMSVGFGAAALAVGAVPPPESKPAGGVLQTQDTNVAGVVAEFMECKVKDGVLSVKIRLRNAGNQREGVSLIRQRDFDKYYVTSGSKKYFVLRDSDNVPLAPAADASGYLSVEIEKGASWTWWAKYPAPPDSQTKINYMWPLGAPFEDVPVSR